MSQRFRRVWMLSAGCILTAAALALGADRPAPDIIKDIDAVKTPAVDRSKIRDQKYIQEYMKQREQALQKRNTLILELYKADPNNERIPELMSQRWNSMLLYGRQLDSLVKELDDALTHTKSDKLKLEATYFKAQAAIASERASGGDKFEYSGN